MQYFLRHGPEQWPGANCSSKTLTSGNAILPVSEELVRYAVRERPLLDSIVAYTAFNMLNEHPDATSLKTFGHHASGAALVSVRGALNKQQDQESLILSYAVLHLCMASISMGQPDAAQVHLRFLIEMTRNFVPANELEYRLMFQIRGIDIRYAIQSGRPPLISTMQREDPIAPTSERDGEILQNMPASGTHVLTPPRSPVDERSPSKNLFPIGHVITSSSLTLEAAQPGEPVEGFHIAIEEDLLSTEMSSIINQYMEAMGYLTGLLRLNKIAILQRIQSRRKCYDCLESLCKQWYFMHRSTFHPATPLSPLGTELQDSSLDSADQMDLVLILAFQIRLLTCLGRYSGHTLVVLSGRLCLYLRTGGLLDTIETSSRRSQEYNFKTGLLLWILLMGMLATTEKSADYQWLQINATVLARSLGADSELSMLNVLKPFSPTDGVIGDDFLGVVKELVKHTP